MENLMLILFGLVAAFFFLNWLFTTLLIPLSVQIILVSQVLWAFLSSKVSWIFGAVPWILLFWVAWHIFEKYEIWFRRTRKEVDETLVEAKACNNDLRCELVSLMDKIGRLQSTSEFVGRHLVHLESLIPKPMSEAQPKVETPSPEPIEPKSEGPRGETLVAKALEDMKRGY